MNELELAPPLCPYCDFFVTYPTDTIEDVADTWKCIRCLKHFIVMRNSDPEIVILFPEDTYPGDATAAVLDAVERAMEQRMHERSEHE